MRRIKEVYSRRTKKEKIFTVLVLAMMVLCMLLVVARVTETAMTASAISFVLEEILLWIFAYDIQIYALAVYAVCALPTIILSAAAIDEVSQKKTEFALPFYFYILLFFVERFFYEPMAMNVVTWFVIILLSACAYLWASRQKGKLMYGMIAIAGLLIIFEKGNPAMAVLRYVILMALNLGTSFVMNRASVLKKKYWLAVMCVMYAVLFAVARLI